MLTDKQKRAATWSNRDGFISLSEGTVRSGKTFSSVIGFMAYTLAQPEPYKHLVLGRKLRVLERELLPTMRNLATGLGGDWNYLRKDNIVRVGRQEYHLIAGNDNRAADRITGLTCHSAIVDEATLVPESFWDMGLSRLMYPGSKCWATCNPQGPKHWLKAKWIDDNRIDERFKFTFEDNPVLTEAVKQRYRDTFSGVFALRMIFGQWAQAEGLIYHDIREAKFTETKTRQIVKTIAGADYGAASPSAFTFLHEVYDRQTRERSYHVPVSIHIPGGRGGKNRSDSELCTILTREAGMFPKMRGVYLDYAAASMRNALHKWPGRRFTVNKARKEIVPGIRLVSNLFSTGKLTIDPDGARPLLDELYSYSWDEKKDDLPLQKDDHHADALRYALMGIAFRGAYAQNIALPKGL